MSAAKRVFAEQGTQASIERIARAAGVGPRTFYRHFTTKDDLIEALLDELADGSRAVAAAAESLDDPWEAFVYVFSHGSVLDERERALFYDLARTSPRAARRAAQATTDAIGKVIERAHDAGPLRPDVGTKELAGLMRMVYRSQSRQLTSTAVQVILDGLRA
jgi:AcrR family transcriptional regulator